MGHNIDLTQLLGLNSKIKCPKCNNLTSTTFDEYDIDCGEPITAPGCLNLDVDCDTCDHEFEVKITIELHIED